MDENQIVEAVVIHLKGLGYVVKQSLTTKEKGIDIIAEHPVKGRILVEAKGGTSTFENSARYGKAYTKSQVFDRVAKGFYTVAEMKEGNRDAVVVFAIPKTKWFEEYLGRIRNSLSALDIKIFLVSAGNIVEEVK
jgi:DNA-binding sugar fermentation-stimulating protein